MGVLMEDARAVDMGVLMEDALALSLAGVKFCSIFLAGVLRAVEGTRVLFRGKKGRRTLVSKGRYGAKACH